MKTIDRDRNSLKRLVEAYGKEDVMKYVNHLDEYMLGGNDWGDDYRRNNPAFIRRIDNSDEIPVNVMEYLWYIGRYGHEFTEILYNGLDIKQSKLRNVRDMSLADVQYWNKVIDPIVGLMSNKTNIKNDDHQITAKDLAQYRNIYMKLESCPCQALQNASRVLMNFVKSIPASSNVNSDRAALESIVSTYGKEDVMKFVKHINEAIDESQAKKAAIMKAYNEIDFEQDSPDDLMRILEELYDAAADEGYQLGYDEGYNQGYNDCDRGDEYE